MTTRKPMTAKRKLEIFQAAQGVCHWCHAKIGVGERWDADHITPLAHGGTEDPSNLAPIHVHCHKEKTRQDVANISRAVRLEQKHLGARKPKGTMPGSKNSKFKRRMDGTVDARQ